jgi:hypothetical protein
VQGESVKLIEELQSKEAEMDLIQSKIQKVHHQIILSSSALADLNKKLKRKKVLIQYYNKQSSIGESNDATCMEASVVCDAIDRAFLMLKGKHNTTKAKLLIEAIMNRKLFKGEAVAAVSDMMWQYIQNLFQPWKFVKSGDISSVGSFKTSTINALRNVVDDKGIGYFPSASSVNRSRALLDNYGIKMVGYHHRDTKYGEVYYLNFEKAFCLLLKACKLEKLAETTSVKVALTVDGAALIKSRTHVSTGIKIPDEHGVHPITGKPFVMEQDDAENIYVKGQTSDVCCVMIKADAIDNKQ